MLICALKVSGSLKGQKKVLDPLEFTVSHHVGVLGIEPGSSAGTSTIMINEYTVWFQNSTLEKK